MRRFFGLIMAPFFKGPIRVAQPRSELRGGVHRVSIRLDQQDLWFESSETTLKVSPEAFASALLIPSLRLGRKLLVDSSVCPIWLRNQRSAAQLVSSWWNYVELSSPAISPSHAAREKIAPPASTSVALHTSSSPQPLIAPPDQGGRTALCFTGGVDSFHTLLRAQPSAELLVFASGYDVNLRDRQRLIEAERTIRAVASEMGKQSVIIASNLRRHWTFRTESWDRSHGGALAALGHLLSDHVSSLQISSTYAQDSSIKWGSNWDLDPLFASSRLAIQHIGAEISRTQRLWQIAEEPIVQRYLRVCWQRRRDKENCGQCEKCVRTMLVLETCGQLENYPTLGKRNELATLIDAVPSVQWNNVPTYQMLLHEELTPEVRRAVERLLERARFANVASHPNRSAAA